MNLNSTSIPVALKRGDTDSETEKGKEEEKDEREEE
jgi:hypothetical protein